MKGAVFIDGENLKWRIRDVFKKKEVGGLDFGTYNLAGLFDAVLDEHQLSYQPAVAELLKRGVRVVYVGFPVNPNHGLIAKTDDRFIISDKEVLAHAPSTLFDAAA